MQRTWVTAVFWRLKAQLGLDKAAKNQPADFGAISRICKTFRYPITALSKSDTERAMRRADGNRGPKNNIHHRHQCTLKSQISTQLVHGMSVPVIQSSYDTT